MIGEKLILNTMVRPEWIDVAGLYLKALVAPTQANDSDNKKALHHCKALNLAPRPGLEPGTCGLTVRRSTN